MVMAPWGVRETGDDELRLSSNTIPPQWGASGRRCPTRWLTAFFMGGYHTVGQQPAARIVCPKKARPVGARHLESACQRVGLCFYFTMMPL